MVPNGTIFDNSLEKGKPYDVRVGAGQVRLLQSTITAICHLHLAKDCFMSTVLQTSTANFNGRFQQGRFCNLLDSLSDADLDVLVIPCMTTPCPKTQVAQSWTL